MNSIKDTYYVKTKNHLQTENKNQSSEFQLLDEEEDFCTMGFDGAMGKEGAGIKIWIRTPMNH